MNPITRFRTGVLAPLILCSVATAADPPSDETADERLRYMKDSVAVYAASAGGDPLTVGGEPSLRWSGATGRPGGGALFVWSRPDGRPAAAAQAFVTSEGVWLHEFQSLAEGPMRFERRGAAVWSPETAGVAPKPLPKAPAPAATEAGRLVQMRTLARRFAATDRFENRGDYELRLLPTPLARYSGGPVRDGALFALANATDPEVLLLIEAREAAGRTEWAYALAPMTGYAIEAKLDGEPVWEAPFRGPPFDPTRPFFITEYSPDAGTQP